MLVSQRMTRAPVAVSPVQSLADALRLTREHRIRHLPVVHQGELVGIVSDRDIRLAMPSPLTEPDPGRADFLQSTPIAGIMSRNVITVGPSDAVEDAAKLMQRHHIGSLPVVDAHGALLGILTETDVLHAFVELLGPAGASSRLEIVLPDRAGQLARAMRIIGEERGVNVCSLMVPPGGPADRRVAIVHVGTIDPREVIAALEGAGFQVGWPSLERDLRAGGLA
ncbi:MAG TPA: CBS and ACT domain-containing protein [Longimicrobium sp.]|jgi:acetoin utilization protein AcuB|uniref:CBS and ACT domain-containing protein n=1 Tax=Longimicrobium sp. TaxID=2029185 RepID=UPI002EDAEEB9